MRFYFDTYEGDCLIRDEEGLEFVDFDAAKLGAAKTVVDTAKELFPDSHMGTVAIHVRDGEGQIVLVTKVEFEARIILNPDGYRSATGHQAEAPAQPIRTS